jgi:hypothetical protein
LAKGGWEEILKGLFQTAKLIQIEILIIIRSGITNGGSRGALLLISFLKILQTVSGESDAVEIR